MSVALACCGCLKMMAQDGTTIDYKSGGGISFTPGIFDGPAAADAAAKKAGWQVKDKKGPNHRCPDCKNRSEWDKQTQQDRGAYIYL